MAMQLVVTNQYDLMVFETTDTELIEAAITAMNKRKAERARRGRTERDGSCDE